MSLFIAAALSGESISVTDADCVDVSLSRFSVLTSIVERAGEGMRFLTAVSSHIMPGGDCRGFPAGFPTDVEQINRI